MKRLLLTLHSLLLVLCSMAQTEIVLVCEKHGDLPTLLTDEIKQKATRLVVSGNVSTTDIKAVDECPNLTVLELSNALLNTIPEHAFCNLQLDSIHLPKSIKQLSINAFDSLSEFVRQQCVIVVTGNFPELVNPILPFEMYETPIVFRLAKENTKYVEVFDLPYNEYHDFSHVYTLYDPFIYSADMDTLYKAQMWSIGEDGILIDVEHIASYAFAYSYAQDYTFSDRLKTIDAHAFDFMIELYYSHIGQPRHEGFIYGKLYYFGESMLTFMGKLPPTLNGQVFYSPLERNHIFNQYGPSFCSVGIVAPDAKDYLRSNSQWYNEGKIFHYRDYDTRAPYNNYYPDEEMKTFDFNAKKWFAGLMSERSVDAQLNEDGSAVLTISCDIASSYTFIVSEDGAVDTILSPTPEWECYTIQFALTSENGDTILRESVECRPKETIGLSLPIYDVPENGVLKLSVKYESPLYGISPWCMIEDIDLYGSGIVSMEKDIDFPYYDLMGRPVANPTRGIYIKDGRKVVIGQ